MSKVVLKVHPKDNIIVALKDLQAGQIVHFDGHEYKLLEDISAKHKFSELDFEIGDEIVMYGVLVGKATQVIVKGTRISTENVKHYSGDFELGHRNTDWEKPNVVDFLDVTFDGYHRSDGSVGTMNYWLIIPLVFCENRNVKVIQEAMVEELGYAVKKNYSVDVRKLILLYQEGADEETILHEKIVGSGAGLKEDQVFKNVDGIKFLTHDGGCGGIRQDSETLCELFAGYISHPNVAGATILSLGCQNAQISLLQKSIKKRHPNLAKPLYYIEQQESLSERAFIAEAVKKTFAGLMKADKIVRKPAPLSHLTIGLECGGSDGFSGITANPSLGYTSDLLVALGGTAILSEFPELNGVEQELINRCMTDELAEKFAKLMKTYADRAIAVGSGFDMNPSPGNIKDGLITDAMKSAGAAKKGGTSPIVDVLDYTEPALRPGLNLLCTPGNDVESTTGLAGSGANIIVFTTGLGTPTGNPISPTIKVSSNNILAEKMSDLIDFNAGTIITGDDDIESRGRALLSYIIEVASGRATPQAVRLGQDDFIPWKRGISL